MKHIELELREDMLKVDDTALVIIDVQGKLAKIMHQSKEVIKNIETLIQGAKLLDIPVLWVEQYPKGLGPTTPEVKQHLSDEESIEKVVFSAYQSETFQEQLKQINRKNLLITGIEAHICVYQTVQDLLTTGHYVEVVTDCVSSRTLADKNVGIEKMKLMGASITSVEMALFELLHTAKNPQFKAISNLIK